MALLATSTMDSSFGGCDEFPQMEGHLVSHQLTMLWEHDASCVADVAGIELADVNMAAPDFLADSIIATESANSGFASNSDWKFRDLPLFPDVFLNDDGFDLESLISGQIPVPPAADSPLQGVNHETLWLTTCLDMSADVTTDPLKDLSTPGSPDSGVSSLDTSTYPDSVASPETSFSPSPEPTMGTVLQEDFALLQSLWENDPPIAPATSSKTGPETLLTTAVALEPPQSISRSTKSLKSSSKALLAAEKRERKRAQNKTAATRYREKKRDGERLVYEEQTGLEKKNKSLKDKVSLISREIECVKELLTEVYRAKGMIE